MKAKKEQVIRVSENDGELVLLEIEPEVFALFSKGPVYLEDSLEFLGHTDELKVTPFMIPEHLRGDFSKVLGSFAGLANIGIQTGFSAEGIVKLAPETIAALKHESPMTNGVYNLGVLLGENGKITQHIQWLPVEGAGVGANLGPAAALFALQMQLNEISRKIDRNIELTEGIAADLAKDREAELFGIVRSVQNAWHETYSVGMSTDKIFGLISSYGKDIEKYRLRYKDQVFQHYEALMDPQKARKYASENRDQISSDVSCFLVAEETWFYWQVMRGLNLSIEASNLEQSQRLLEAHNRKTVAGRGNSITLMAKVIETLEDQLTLLSIVQRKAPLEKVPVLRNRNQLKIDSLEALRAQISQYAMDSVVPQEELLPIVKWDEGKDDPDLLAMIQYSLPRRTPVLAVVRAKKDLIAVITDHELKIGSKDQLEKGTRAFTSHQLADIRYVRAKQASDKLYQIRIITVDEDIDLAFSLPAKGSDEVSALEGFVEMLKTTMNLPLAEIARNQVMLDPPHTRAALRELESKEALEQKPE